MNVPSGVLPRNGHFSRITRSVLLFREEDVSDDWDP